MEKVIVTNHNILLMGSFINDFHTNLGIFGTPPCSAQVCPHLDDHPPSPSPCGHKTRKILILDVHTCVLLLDNFDNSIPKDGVDQELNVTQKHDWPNKNASVPKSLSGKRKDFIFQPL